MNLKLRSLSGEGTLILEYPIGIQRFFSVLFFLLGLALLFAGGSLPLSYPPSDFLYLWPLTLGAGALSGGLGLHLIFKGPLLKRLEFDTRRRHLRIHSRGAKIADVISFEDLLGFRQERRSQPRENKSERVVYAVTLLKKDGAIWNLGEWSREEKAAEFLRELNRLELESEFSAASGETFSVPESSELTGASGLYNRRSRLRTDANQVAWKNRMFMPEKFANLLAVGGLVLIGFQGFSLEEFWILSLFFWLFLPLLIIFLLDTLTSWRIEFLFHIQGDTLKYEVLNAPLRWGPFKGFELSLDNIQAVTCNVFTRTGMARLEFVGGDEYSRRMKKFQENQPADAGEVLSFISGLIRRTVDLSALSFTDVLELERRLEDMLFRATGREIV